ncbi:MAG: flagellar biosynthesis protein FlhA [Phycisphaerales bacterium]|nr:flagellar biosynthesis protein FlhA [Phycisphaerales bacterium]
MAGTFLDRPAPKWVQLLHANRALLVPVGFLLLVVVILVPLPPLLMDVLLCLNIALAVMILMTTMYIREPLEFSVFPSLLLGVTLLRLVTNVASTRLILTADATSPEQAQQMAGKVIAAFGSFVAAGSLVVGVILFLILVIVQFVVITKGATRIGEVAARFTLDAMPGKQMAIDADLNAGVIDEKEARRRREKLSDEADFFGAMDGAGKFVRGDAVAGLIITVINVLGGFAIGSLVKGWDVAQTAKVFTVLTIGDGLASQMPAFLIAIAAALIITRSGEEENLGAQFTAQLSSKPVALFITAGMLLFLMVTPLPKLPLLSIAGVLIGIGLFGVRTARAAEVSKQAAAAQESKAAPAGPPVEDLLKVDTLELEVGYGLVGLVDAKQGGDLLERIAAVRRQLAAEIGLVMPPVRIRDNMTLPPNVYRVKIRGNVVAQSETRPGMLLAMDSGITSGPIPGDPTREPAFGLDAWWIPPNLKGRAETLNYTVVDPTSVLTTHLAEIVKGHAAELLTREEVNNLVAQLKQHAPKLVEEAIPAAVSMGDLQKILQALLRERVPVRDMESIVETLAEWSPRTKDTDVLVEYARNALRRSICMQHAAPADPAAPGGRMRLVCVTLDPAFEDFINGYIDRGPAGTTISIPAGAASGIARRIMETLGPVTRAGHQPIVIASPQVRAPVRQLLEPYLPSAVVLGYNEIIPGIEVESMGLVTLPDAAAATAAA